MVDPDQLQRHVMEAWSTFSEHHPGSEGDKCLAFILNKISVFNAKRMSKGNPIDEIPELESYVNYSLFMIRPGLPGVPAPPFPEAFNFQGGVKCLFKLLEGVAFDQMPLDAAYDLAHRMLTLRTRIQAEPAARDEFALQAICLLLGEVERRLDELLRWDRGLAVGMALHARLGREAPIQCLGGDLMSQVRPGAPGGRP